MSESDYETADEGIPDSNNDYPFEYQSSYGEADQQYYTPNTSLASRSGSSQTSTHSSFKSIKRSSKSVASQKSQASQSYGSNLSTPSTHFGESYQQSKNVLGLNSPLQENYNQNNSIASRRGRTLQSQGSTSSTYSRKSYKQNGNILALDFERQEKSSNQCKSCRGPGCGFYVCACRGKAGVVCLRCIEHSIKSREEQGLSDLMVCSDCNTKYFGVSMVRGQPILGMDSTIVNFCIFGPLVIFGFSMMIVGVTFGSSSHWVKVFGGLMLFIYIFESLVFGYCAYHYRKDTAIRGVQITSRALRMRSDEEVIRDARKLHTQLSTIIGKFGKSSNGQLDDVE